MTTFTLAAFNVAPAGTVVTELETILGSATLAAAVADARPFTSVDALVGAASALLAVQREADVLEAVNAHPPIGGAVTAGSRSASEQSGVVESADLDAVRDLQPAYREHFGWNFLIMATGRSSAEIRAELERRLTVDPADEWAFSVGQLDAINGLRLRGTVTG
ncbi:2-oxo-4-hydroxy-4-carboxy-5-ureidoimidazoline decarboxylase [uncultured Corynebacterium sp.]|uniref:2-oxo-4-hydroxy-4-carboxy-5-ureidoimidazoline decarboxylase n=1 Tax=uncultured Corynebacterium sp. TaxID=159447 RepID=UPI0025F0468A|nr:2-oxo-4-hydroxy-4-carboxy-5-ureidoimidazoline decarboxylase [uncultured Corynebacterium sp.]